MPLATLKGILWFVVFKSILAPCGLSSCLTLQPHLQLSIEEPFDILAVGCWDQTLSFYHLSGKPIGRDRYINTLDPYSPVPTHPHVCCNVIRYAIYVHLKYIDIFFGHYCIAGV